MQHMQDIKPFGGGMAGRWSTRTETYAVLQMRSQTCSSTGQSTIHSMLTCTLQSTVHASVVAHMQEGHQQPWRRLCLPCTRMGLSSTHCDSIELPNQLLRIAAALAVILRDRQVVSNLQYAVATTIASE